MRRKFVDAQRPSKRAGSAEEALGRISRIYEIEKRLRAEGLSDDEFVARRKKEVEPVLASFHPWLKVKAQKVPPKTLMGRAVGYALSQWKKLDKYLERTFMSPDTNLVLCSGYHNPQDSGKSFGKHTNQAFAA